MRKRHEYGVWELFVPIARANQIYGYRIHSQNGDDFVKIDPYAQEFENPPKYASIISEHDDAYRKVKRKNVFDVLASQVRWFWNTGHSACIGSECRQRSVSSGRTRNG